MPRPEQRTPSIAQRSSLGRTAARKLAAAAEAAPAPAPTAGVTVQAHGHGGLARRGAAKTPSQIVDAKLLWDCWKETARGVKSRAQFEAFCKGLGIRVQWLNLDGGGVNCILYLVMGKNKRTVPIQCQYKYGQDHFAERRMAEAFGVPQLLYVDADGKLVAQFADGVRTPAPLRIHHAAPDAAISVRSLYNDLATLAALDSTSSAKNWVERTGKGVVCFGRGSMGPKFINRHDTVQKALALDPTKAAVAPYIDMRAADAHEQFLHAIESALTFALSAVRAARAESTLASKLFLRERKSVRGPFATLKEKGAAEKIAFDQVEALQLKLVAASTRQALVVAPTAADAHLSKLAVKPLAFVTGKPATPEEAVRRLKLKFMVRPGCTKGCHLNRPSCKCKRVWKDYGTLINLRRFKKEAGVALFFDSGKDVQLDRISCINERVKPASGNGDGLSLVRKAARAAVLSGWTAPAGLASVSRAARGG